MQSNQMEVVHRDRQRCSQESMETKSKRRYSKRRALLLKERVTVIQLYNSKPRPNYETLAKMFNCGRSQIKNILRQQDDIMQEFQKNPDSERVRRSVPTVLLALNHMLDEWVKRALALRIPVTDRILAQVAGYIQHFLHFHEFVPTKTWMRSFKRRHGYYQVDMTTLKPPNDVKKSLKLKEIFEDIRDYIDPIVSSEIEVRVKNPNAIPIKKKKIPTKILDVNENQEEEERLKNEEEEEKESSGPDSQEHISDQDCKEEISMISEFECSEDTKMEDSSSDYATDEIPSLPGDNPEGVVLKDNAEAIKYLKPLEEFAMLSDNFRAIGLITQLETIFKSRIQLPTDPIKTEFT